MSQQPLTEDQRKVVAQVADMSADDVAEWLSKGFRALAENDQAKRPFGGVRDVFWGDDITDDLATIYHSLHEAQSAFVKGLDAVFRQMNARKADDQRALIFILRLAAKIQNGRLLPLLTKKLFAEGAQTTDQERKLRSVALDVAVELSARSPHAAENLQNIVNSNLFRSSAAATILLALCSASPDELIDHLFRLENQLAQVYDNAAAAVDLATKRRRALLLADLTDHATVSVIGSVVEFALRNRAWSLSWLADVLLDETLLESLPEDDAFKTLDLRQKLQTRQIRLIDEPDWVKQLQAPAADIGQRKEDFETLTSEDADPQEKERIFQSMVDRLVREDRSLLRLRTGDRERLLEDIDAQEVG